MVQFVHRTIAVIIFLLVFYQWLGKNSLIWKLNQEQKAAANYSMFFITIQALLGIFTLVLNVPLWLGVVHQAGAYFIFAAVLHQVHRLTK